MSDPSGAMGNDISARQLLDDGAQRIDREFAGQPLVNARLMLTMGLVYMSLGVNNIQTRRRPSLSSPGGSVLLETTNPLKR